MENGCVRVGEIRSDLDVILDRLSLKPAHGYTRAYNRYERDIEDIKLNSLKKLVLWLTGKTKVEERTYPGWTGKLPFYAYTTDINGRKVTLFDYAHGREGRLDHDIPIPNGF